MAIEITDEDLAQVYIALGIDQSANDHILGVYHCFKTAIEECSKKYILSPSKNGLFDVWIEKHTIR